MKGIVSKEVDDIDTQGQSIVSSHIYTIICAHIHILKKLFKQRNSISFFSFTVFSYTT